MSDAKPPETPETPPSGPLAPDEAQRLLEVGLSGAPTRVRSRFTVPTAAELQARFPDLEILELVGQGGMGAVYRARQRRLDRVVALKVLPQELSEDPAFTERFVREARALAKLQHPHIVGVYEFGDKDGLFYLLLEYVDGVTLRQLMQTDSLSPREALAIVPQICDALQFAHNAGVVHRDVKPENILLDRAGRVKVTDFGLAKLANPTPEEMTLTGTGQIMGTLHYMAPEQYKTPNDVDHRADIFSLGVVFYEMLTGDLPVGNFERPSMAASLDARLDEIVMRTLERQRDRRYQQAADVESDVNTVLNHPAPDAGPVQVAPPQGHHGHRQRRRAHHGDDRPFSAWAAWCWWVLLAAPVIGLGVYAFVYNTAAERSGFYGTISGAIAAISLGLLAALIALIAIIRVRSAQGRLRGHAPSVVCMVVSLILCGAFASYFAGETRNMQRSWNMSYRPPHPNPIPELPAGLVVRGAAPGTDVRVIANAVRSTWFGYQRAIRNGQSAKSIGLGGVYVPRGAVAELRADPELDAKIERRELGLGFMGRDQWSLPPWSFEIRRIQVDEWETEATVTLRHKGLGNNTEVVFPMQKVGAVWVFTLKPVVFRENKLAPLTDGGG